MQTLPGLSFHRYLLTLQDAYIHDFKNKLIYGRSGDITVKVGDANVQVSFWRGKDFSTGNYVSSTNDETEWEVTVRYSDSSLIDLIDNMKEKDLNTFIKLIQINGRFKPN